MQTVIYVTKITKEILNLDLYSGKKLCQINKLQNVMVTANLFFILRKYGRFNKRFRRQRDDMDEVIDQFIERQPPDRMAKRIEKSIRRFSVPVNYMHARQQERPRRDSDLNRARESRRRNLRQPRERRFKTQMQAHEPPLSPLSDVTWKDM